jgi:hypothetical protein
MKSAAQTLAASIASSISRCASLRVRGTIFSMRPFVIADDLRLDGLEVHRTARRALLQQRPVHLVQMQQVRQQIGAPLRLGAARVGQAAATSV